MRPFPNPTKIFLFHRLTNHPFAICGHFKVFLSPQKGPVRKKDFCEDLRSLKCKSSYFQINLFLTLSMWYPLFREISTPFTKMEDSMKQFGLLPPETLPSRIQYDLLFEHLPSLSLKGNKRGRPPFPQDALLKAFIYKALRRLKTLSDLAFEFQNNPMSCHAVGLNLYETPPSIERFSQFLRETPHPILQTVRIQLVQTLLKAKVISGKHLVMDSCALLARVRENNLKTSVSNRFDKTKRPKGDPDARLGILIHFPYPFKKEVRYFWGYRNHIVADAEEELPLWEVTHPANISEIHQAIPMLQRTKETFSLMIDTVSGDAIYDTENILRFIIDDLKAQPVIPQNPRNNQTTSYILKGNDVYCQADLPMYRKGKMTVKKIKVTYLQYSCPIHFGRERQRHLICPAAHPKFITQKGCNVLIRLTPSIRQHINYGSEAFKKLYKKRTSVERVFSRLLSIAMQDSPVIGINATQNYCTIAHITVLLVALAAKRLGHQDKIRFVRSFVPNFLSESGK
jgi:hypothetical protein